MRNAGCRSLRSKDSSQGDGHDAVGDFVKELEHTRATSTVRVARYPANRQKEAGLRGGVG